MHQVLPCRPHTVWHFASDPLTRHSRSRRRIAHYGAAWFQHSAVSIQTQLGISLSLPSTDFQPFLEHQLAISKPHEMLLSDYRETHSHWVVALVAWGQRKCSLR